MDLGVLEQAVSGIVRGLNTTDEVVGGSIGFGRGKRAFLVTGGRAENLEGFPGTDSSSAHAINDQTTVVGSSNTASSIRAFIWTRKDGVQDLGTLPGDSGSEAFGINRHDEVVGYSSGPGGIEAVLWASNGAIQGLGRLRDGDYSRAFAINESGDVVGSSGRSLALRAPFSGRATVGWRIWAHCRATLKAQPRGSTIPAEWWATQADPAEPAPFFGRAPVGWRISAPCRMAISAVLWPSTNPATSWEHQGALEGPVPLYGRSGRGIEDLNTLIPAGNNFVLTEALNINNRGTILAIGHDDDGQGDSP